MHEHPISYLSSFEGLRGVAALGVFVYHFHHIAAFDALTNYAPTFFSQGWIFVDLFFVLSGWVMAHVYFLKLSQKQWSDVLNFMTARVARLYPLHIVVLISWLLIFYVMQGGLPEENSLARLASQVSLTFTWGPLAAAPFVPPAWSISAEFAAYLVYPILVRAGIPSTNLRAVALIGIGLAGYLILNSAYGTIHVIDGRAPIRSISGFLIGVGMWKLASASGPRALVRTGKTEALALIVFLAAVLLGNFSLGFLVSGAILVFAVSSGEGPVAQLLQLKPFQILGRLSFSMYMWHWFAIVALQNSPRSYSAVEGVFVITGLVVGVLIWSELSVRLIEQPMGKILTTRLTLLTCKENAQFRLSKRSAQ